MLSAVGMKNKLENSAISSYLVIVAFDVIMLGPPSCCIWAKFIDQSAAKHR